MTDIISKCSEIFKQKVWRTQNFDDFQEILVQVSIKLSMTQDFSVLWRVDPGVAVITQG